MKKLLLFTFSTFIVLTTYQPLLSQAMAVTTGVGATHYFDLIKDEQLMSNYGVGKSYFLKVDFSNRQSSSLFSNVALKLEKQSGDIDYSSHFYGCGMGRTSNSIYTNEHIEKYTLSIISYPITFPVFKNILIRSGFAINKSFHFSSNSNYKANKNNDDLTFSSNIDNRTFGADAVFEIQLGTFHLGNGISILPVYNAFIGLTKEFQGDYNTHSIRQSLGLSFLWELKRK